MSISDKNKTKNPIINGNLPANHEKDIRTLWVSITPWDIQADDMVND